MKNLGWQVDGIEPDSDPEAAMNSEKYAINIIQESVAKVNISRSSYDEVVLSHVIEHLHEPRHIIQKLITCLKPNGLLISISPNPI